jgi:hypothetical protein
MKNFKLFLAAAMVVIALFGCEPPVGPTGPGGDNSDPYQSEWKIKGTFNDWATENFRINELDPNELTFEITELVDLTTVSFILESPEGLPFKQLTAGDIADGNPVTFEHDTDGSKHNGTFVPSSANYTVVVDITDPVSVELILNPGTEPPLPATFQVFAEALVLEGSMFGATWTNLGAPDVIDEGSQTATYQNVSIVNQYGDFGVNSEDGFLKGAYVQAPDTVGLGSAIVDLLYEHSVQNQNAHIDNLLYSDSLYDIVIHINMAATDIQDKYDIQVFLATEGTTEWPALTPWPTVVINGSWENPDNFQAGLPATETSPGSGIWEFNLTTGPGATLVKFKPGQTGWSDAKGRHEITQGTGSLYLGNTGDISFEATENTDYTIQVSFPATGKPIVVVTSP